jgi:hypothetical protein
VERISDRKLLRMNQQQPSLHQLHDPLQQSLQPQGSPALLSQQQQIQQQAAVVNGSTHLQAPQIQVNTTCPFNGKCKAIITVRSTRHVVMAHSRKHHPGIQLSDVEEKSYNLTQNWCKKCKNYWSKTTHPCLNSHDAGGVVGQPVAVKNRNRNLNDILGINEEKKNDIQIPRADRVDSRYKVDMEDELPHISVNLKRPIRRDVSQANEKNLLSACLEVIESGSYEENIAELENIILKFLMIPDILLAIEANDRTEDKDGKGGHNENPNVLDGDEKLVHDMNMRTRANRAKSLAHSQRFGKAVNSLFQDPAPPITVDLIKQLEELHPPAPFGSVFPELPDNLPVIEVDPKMLMNSLRSLNREATAGPSG